MTKEEIEKRIEHCEMMEMAHREVGNTKSANRFNNKKYKWEKLLSELNPKKDEELRTYKTGYYNLKQALIEIREYIHTNSHYYSTDDGNVDFVIEEEKEEIFCKDLLQIIDKVLGDSNE